MYAVVEISGVQIRVAKGDKVKIPLQKSNPGDKLMLDKVLLIANKEKSWIGTPALEKVSIPAEVLQNGRLAKVIVYKKKKRRDYRRTRGHRQDFTQIQIGVIPTPKKEKE